MATTQPKQAVAKRSSDLALMPPPPPPKRIKRPSTVLDEDEYTRALSHIIARDYFPSLLEAEAQEEYLDALDSKDGEWIRDASTRMREAMTPRQDGQRGRRGVSMTPTIDRGGSLETPRGWAGDTPVSVLETNGQGEEDRPQKPKVNLNLSLTAFQATYTSEDDESFNTSLDKQNAQRAERHSWLYHGNQIPSARQIAWRKRDAKLLEAQGHAEEPNASAEATTSEPNNATSTSTTLTTQNPRPAMPLHRPSAPRNALMFQPSSIEDTHQTRAEAAAAASNAPHKSVSQASTRFAVPLAPTTSTDTVPPSPSLSAIDDAIRGRPRDATISEAGYSGAETPRVNGYKFVDAQPTEAELRAARGETGVPEGNNDGEGEDGLEFLRKLHGGEVAKGPNPFTIHAASKREDLLHRIVEKQNGQKRASGMGTRLTELMGGKTPAGQTPRFASAAGVKSRGGLGQGGLTPAGERLLRSVGTPKREGLFGGEGKKGESSKVWTPTPRMRKKAAG